MNSDNTFTENATIHTQQSVPMQTEQTHHHQQIENVQMETDRNININNQHANINVNTSNEHSTNESHSHPNGESERGRGRGRARGRGRGRGRSRGRGRGSRINTFYPPYNSPNSTSYNQSPYPPTKRYKRTFDNESGTHRYTQVDYLPSEHVFENNEIPPFVLPPPSICVPEPIVTSLTSGRQVVKVVRRPTIETTNQMPPPPSRGRRHNRSKQARQRRQQAKAQQADGNNTNSVTSLQTVASNISNPDMTITIAPVDSNPHSTPTRPSKRHPNRHSNPHHTPNNPNNVPFHSTNSHSGQGRGDQVRGRAGQMNRGRGQARARGRGRAKGRGRGAHQFSLHTPYNTTDYIMNAAHPPASPDLDIHFHEYGSMGPTDSQEDYPTPYSPDDYDFTNMRRTRSQSRSRAITPQPNISTQINHEQQRGSRSRSRSHVRSIQRVRSRSTSLNAH
jgi:hypothetical protein